MLANTWQVRRAVPRSAVDITYHAASEAYYAGWWAARTGQRRDITTYLVAHPVPAVAGASLAVWRAWHRGYAEGLAG